MNLADLTAVLTVIVGFAGASTTAASAGAPWWVTILCGAVGLLAGLCLAFVAGRIAYALLNSNSRIAFVAYILFPFAALSVATFVIITGTLATLQEIGYAATVSSPTNNNQISE